MSPKTSKNLNQISHAGSSTENLFAKLTGFSPTSKSNDGDFIYKGSSIEVKKVTLNTKTRNGTINQIRALKNLVLVIHISNRRKWIVLDSREVFSLVTSMKKRGQHCESPFECCNISIANLRDAGLIEIPSKELKKKVISAVIRTRRDFKLKVLSQTLLHENKVVAKKHHRLVQEALKTSN